LDLDLLDLYGNASEWAGTKVRGAVSDLDSPTTCDGWTVRTLMNHMLETQRYFVGSARGDAVTLSQEPPDLLGEHPAADFERARAETLRMSLSARVRRWALRSATSCFMAGTSPSQPVKTPRCPKASLKLRMR
jgi:hypothetical protein